MRNQIGCVFCVCKDCGFYSKGMGTSRGFEQMHDVTVVFYIYIYIYRYDIYKICWFTYQAVSGLSCGTQDFCFRRGLSSCGVVGFSCPTAHGISVPQPGIELMSSVLEGGFFSFLNLFIFN